MLDSRIFNPRSVAVVGASRNPTKRGHQIVRALLEGDFEGVVHAVHPTEESVLGLRCHVRLADIEEPVDVVYVATAAHTVPDVLADCAAKGVAGAVVVAGGFGETGEEGRSLERKMKENAREGGVRIIGPNTSGMMKLSTRLNLAGIPDVPQGNIALISQSGNMALAVITEASIKSRSGFSHYVGVGNETDIRFDEYLEYFEEDQETRAILIYMEGMKDARSFLQQAYQTTRKKPVVLLKSGRTEKGKLSASSHTGAIAGISDVANTAFGRAGIVVVQDSDQLFPVTEALANLNAIKNNNVAILADGGGHATIASDIFTDLNVNIPPLRQGTMDKLREILPAAATVSNPVDVAGGADDDPVVLAKCARILMNDPAIGGVLVAGLFGGYAIRFDPGLAIREEDAAHRFGRFMKEAGKPIIFHSLYSYAKPHALELLRYYKMPVHDSLEIACKCMGALAEYGGYLQGYKAKYKFTFSKGEKAKPRGRELIEASIKEGRGALYEMEAKELIGLHSHIANVDCLASSAEEAVALASSMAEPVVMKVVSPDILHKSDANGVRLNLDTPDKVAAAYDGIIESAKNYDPNARIRGVLVSPMAKGGMECIIGTKIDPQFGPVVMFGVGGIMVEILKDVAFRVLPVSPYSAKKMINDIKGVKLLEGYRGQPPLDKRALQRLILAVSEVVGSYKEIAEIDLNPVIVHPEGITIADARIILKNQPSF